MQTKHFSFQTIKELEQLDNSLDSTNTLLQVFLTTTDTDFIQNLQQFLQKRFPKAVVLGATTDGVIDGKEHYDNAHLISIVKFEKTTLDYCFVEHPKTNACCFETGVNIAKKLIKENTKVLISFSDGLHSNGEDFVKGIASVNSDIFLAGGMAGDIKMEETVVFDKFDYTSKGVVAVALHSDELYVSNSYSFDWTPIGKELVINKVVKNRVYEIDGMRAVDVYAKYLGNEIAKELPKTGIEFPLIFKQNDTMIGRAVLAKHEDGSLTFAGNIKEGTKVRFGVGNVDLIIRDAHYKIDKNIKSLHYQPEAIFTYSCMARKHFLQDYIDMELAILNMLGYVCGFYTYGEFYHAPDGNELLNETMTLLVLSEGKERLTVENTMQSLPSSNTVSTVHALANLANVVSHELETLNKDLEEKIKKNTEFIYRQAYFDKLTSLPNRISLIERLKKSVNEVLILINIDDFTSINDFYGHVVGDKVLVKLSKVLQEFIKDKDAELYKLPSDEFAIVMQAKLDYDFIESCVKEILHTVEQTVFQIDDITLYINVSIAASLTNAQGSGLANADMALKHAKKTGKSYIIYKDDINILEKYQENLSMATELKEAIDEDRIIPYYQPIVDPRTGKIVKYEALVRLLKTDGSVISPYFFLELAQKIKLYPKITEIMIDKTFAFFAKNKKEFSINLAFDDILNEKTTSYLFTQIKNYNIAEQLTVEILETQEITKESSIIGFLEKLHAIGVKVAIDDFGSGFANFEYLAKIDADFIKIDGSLIKNIDTNQHAKIVTETIVSFAKKLGKKTIAEFVHSKKIYDIVQELDIDYMQGYYLAEPMVTLKEEVEKPASIE